MRREGDTNGQEEGGGILRNYGDRGGRRRGREGGDELGEMVEGGELQLD